MKHISLYPNLQRDPDLKITLEIARLLLAGGARVTLCREWMPYLSPILESAHFVPEEALFENCELLVVFGGDGTVLTAAKKAAIHQIPVFGINLGNVGFLASLEAKDAQQITRIFREKLILSRRMLLSASVNGVAGPLAMNEFVIAPERGFHLVSLSLSADGRKLCDYRADGLILHTPTGSTGYAFSAGGALVENSFDCIGIQPIAPYMRRNAQHMIFSPETVFTVEKIFSSEERVLLCADGVNTLVLNKNDLVRIERAKESVLFASFQRDSNLDVYFRKFQEQI